ncbi:MAG: CoA-binding protein [Anaerolineae bacterium]
MTSKAAVQDFLAQRTLAVVGASRDDKKFGNKVYKDLIRKGYQTYPVNPHAGEIEGQPCYPDLKSLPELVDGVVFVVPPAQTEQMVREAAGLGIVRVWMQQGSESEEAIRFAEEQGMSVVAGECILMFAEPAEFYHRLHRWVWGLLGRLPA